MRKHKNKGTIDGNALLVSRATLYELLDCGRAAGDAVAKAANAERRIGRRVMVYLPAVRDFLETGQEVEVK